MRVARRDFLTRVARRVSNREITRALGNAFRSGGILPPTGVANWKTVAWASARAIRNHAIPMREIVFYSPLSQNFSLAASARTVAWALARAFPNPSPTRKTVFYSPHSQNAFLAASTRPRRRSLFDHPTTESRSAGQNQSMKIPFFDSWYDKVWLETPQQSCSDLRTTINTTEFMVMPKMMNSADMLCKNFWHQPDLKQSGGVNPWILWPRYDALVIHNYQDNSRFKLILTHQEQIVSNIFNGKRV